MPESVAPGGVLWAEGEVEAEGAVSGLRDAAVADERVDAVHGVGGDLSRVREIARDAEPRDEAVGASQQVVAAARRVAPAERQPALLVGDRVEVARGAAVRRRARLLERLEEADGLVVHAAHYARAPPDRRAAARVRRTPSLRVL